MSLWPLTISQAQGWRMDRAVAGNLRIALVLGFLP